MIMQFRGYLLGDTIELKPFWGILVVEMIARVSEFNPQPHTIYSYPSLQINIY